jgi:hypothetical protein
VFVAGTPLFLPVSISLVKQVDNDADHHSGSEDGSGSESEEEEEGEEEAASQASGSDKGKGLFGLALPKFGTCCLLGDCYSSNVASVVLSHSAAV